LHFALYKQLAGRPAASTITPRAAPFLDGLTHAQILQACILKDTEADASITVMMLRRMFRNRRHPAFAAKAAVAGHTLSERLTVALTSLETYGLLSECESGEEIDEDDATRHIQYSTSQVVFMKTAVSDHSEDGTSYRQQLQVSVEAFPS
jgi:hypothetical protein